MNSSIKANVALRILKTSENCGTGYEPNEKASETRKFSTSTFPGRILYVLSREMIIATREQIISAAAENGWRMDAVNTSRQIGILEKDGLVVRIEGRPMVFRLPDGVKVTVEED